MTQVIGFNGSPRTTGNTAVLMETLLEGAAAAGAETSLVSLNAVTMRGCQACYRCKTTGACAEKDEMTALYPRIDAADVVVLGGPIYMGSITGQLKLFIDRLYPYLNSDFTSRMAPGKTAVLIITQGNPQTASYEAHTQMLTGVLKVLGFTHVEELVVAAGVNNSGEVANDTELMQRMRDLGAQLARKA